MGTPRLAWHGSLPYGPRFSGTFKKKSQIWLRNNQRNILYYTLPRTFIRHIHLYRTNTDMFCQPIRYHLEWSVFAPCSFGLIHLLGENFHFSKNYLRRKGIFGEWNQVNANNIWSHIVGGNCYVYNIYLLIFGISTQASIIVCQRSNNAAIPTASILFLFVSSADRPFLLPIPGRG